ncbi:MAG: alpha/beta hydrolase [Lachnospiraceae bacterium]|nr:alpha/beta hydrolase [Lachnospiraceae bacterium]
MKRAYVEIQTDRIRPFQVDRELQTGRFPFQMHYRHAGDSGKKLLLLHMSGSSSDEFERAGDLLAERGFHVYAPDLPGFGMSDPPPCTPPSYLTMEEHAGMIAAFMDAVGIPAAYVYGNMATANLAVHLAVDFPKQVRGLMLAHPLYTHDAEQYARKRKLPEYSIVHPKNDGSHLITLWERSAKYGASADTADGRCLALHLAGIYGETLHWALFEDRGFSDCLEQITVPTIVVRYGGLGVLGLQREAAQKIKGSILDCYEEGTPYISREDPMAVVEMIGNYFGKDLPETENFIRNGT